MSWLRTNDDRDLEAATTTLESEPVRSGGRPQPRVIRPRVLVVDRIYLLLRHRDAGASAERPHRDARGVDQPDEGGISGAPDSNGGPPMTNRLRWADVR